LEGEQPRLSQWLQQGLADQLPCKHQSGTWKKVFACHGEELLQQHVSFAA